MTEQATPDPRPDAPGAAPDDDDLRRRIDEDEEAELEEAEVEGGTEEAG